MHLKVSIECYPCLLNQVLAHGPGKLRDSGRLTHASLYFLLRAQCQKVARELGVNQGSMGLKKQHRQV